MKTIVFISIVLISGGLAGLVHGTINFAIVEPYLDQAIGLENESLFASGEAEDTLEFWAEYESYRIWQKSGQVLAGVILGLAMGSLFGIVFALSRNSLPGKNIVTKAVFLSGLMWFMALEWERHPLHFSPESGAVFSPRALTLALIL